MRTFLTIAATVMLASTALADAAGVRFEASVSSESITQDQEIDLTITLDRAGAQPFESYRAPSAPDFDLLHTGASEQTQFSSANGRASVRVIEQHVYVYHPKKRGALKIGPAMVRIAGTDLKTREITVHVGAPLKNAMSSVGKAPQPGIALPPPPDELRGGEDLFVDAGVDKTKVYVGQQVTASWHLYTDSQILKYRPLAEPKYEDFWSEDLFVPTSHLAWDRAVVKGHEYEVSLLLKKALFPLKAGKLAITALEAEATTMETAFMAGASDTRKSKALTVDVMPLPVEGRPAGFEPSNVGHYELSSSVDRSAVKAGEAVTWKVTVRGVGNIRNVRLPPYAKMAEKLDGWRVYEPTTKETIDPGDEIHGQKVYTYLLLPQKGGALTVPPVELAYFDPTTAKYGVAKSQPIALTIEGDPTKVESASPTSPTENVLGQQVRPIRNRANVHGSVGDRLFRGRIAIIMLAVPPGAWLLVLIGDALRRRLGRETAGSKRRRARRSARRRLRVAEYHIKAARPSAFFGECARVLYEHLEYRLGNKVEAFTLGELREYLIARAFDRETVEATVKELENCDFSRFAPSASGPGEMRAAMRRVRALLPLIERQKPIEREPSQRSERSSSSRPIVISGLIFALFCATSARAADTEIAASKDATFRRGNDAYFHGHYQQAVDAYEQVVALGVVSADLFYNLGNAYLKNDQLGPAIYDYERALELDPSQEDVRFNLGVARDAARKKGEDRLAGVESQPFWMRAASQVTVNWASWLFLGLYVALFALLIVLHFVQPGFLRVGMWAGFAFLGLATVVGGALLGARLYLADRVEQAIVLPDVVQVKEGPDPNYQSVFGVHAGLRVRMTEKEQDWVRIRLANGLEGWVRERDLGRL
ncbi:MAG TPA: BatD family protein [Polyangia bacterium]